LGTPKVDTIKTIIYHLNSSKNIANHVKSSEKSEIILNILVNHLNLPHFPMVFPIPRSPVAEAIAQGRPGPGKRGAAQCGSGAGAAGVAGGFLRATVPWCWKSLRWLFVLDLHYYYELLYIIYIVI